jgi:hypothetical protein
MSLSVIDGGGDDDGGRVLAPGAPLSPGSCPNDLAQHLEHGEVLVWWNEKSRIQFGLAGITLGAAAVALLLVTGFAPTFWSQPISGLWKPVLALLSPTLVVLAREWTSRTALLVTDNAIIEVPRGGGARRLALPRIVSVKRDWLRGGLRLAGPNTTIQVPTSLMEDAGKAVRSRLRGRLRVPEGVSDPLRFLS